MSRHYQFESFLSMTVPMLMSDLRIYLPKTLLWHSPYWRLLAVALQSGTSGKAKGRCEQSSKELLANKGKAW
jgi:hypothetical protein